MNIQMKLISWVFTFQSPAMQFVGEIRFHFVICKSNLFNSFQIKNSLLIQFNKSNNKPVDEFIGNLTDNRQVISHIFGFEQRLLGFGADPPPGFAVVEYQSGGMYEYVGTFLTVRHHRLGGHPVGEPSFVAVKGFSVFRPRDPHQRRPSGYHVLGDPAVQVDPLLGDFELTTLISYRMACPMN